jgi:hypothetical protein
MVTSAHVKQKASRRRKGKREREREPEKVNVKLCVLNSEKGRSEWKNVISVTIWNVCADDDEDVEQRPNNESTAGVRAQRTSTKPVRNSRLLAKPM